MKRTEGPGSHHRMLEVGLLGILLLCILCVAYKVFSSRLAEAF